jgi:hypothetical protein
VHHPAGNNAAKIAGAEQGGESSGAQKGDDQLFRPFASRRSMRRESQIVPSASDIAGPLLGGTCWVAPCWPNAAVNSLGATAPVRSIGPDRCPDLRDREFEHRPRHVRYGASDAAGVGLDTPATTSPTRSDA